MLSVGLFPLKTIYKMNCYKPFKTLLIYFYFAVFISTGTHLKTLLVGLFPLEYYRVTMITTRNILKVCFVFLKTQAVNTTKLCFQSKPLYMLYKGTGGIQGTYINDFSRNRGSLCSLLMVLPEIIYLRFQSTTHTHTHTHTHTVCLYICI